MFFEQMFLKRHERRQAACTAQKMKFFFKDLFKKFLKLFQTENDLNLLYLPHELYNYHPKKVLDLDLMCPFVIKNLIQM